MRRAVRQVTTYRLAATAQRLHLCLDDLEQPVTTLNVPAGKGEVVGRVRWPVRASKGGGTRYAEPQQHAPPG